MRVHVALAIFSAASCCPVAASHSAWAANSQSAPNCASAGLEVANPGLQEGLGGGEVAAMDGDRGEDRFVLEDEVAAAGVFDDGHARFELGEGVVPTSGGEVDDRADQVRLLDSVLHAELFGALACVVGGG